MLASLPLKKRVRIYPSFHTAPYRNRPSIVLKIPHSLNGFSVKNEFWREPQRTKNAFFAFKKKLYEREPQRNIKLDRFVSKSIAQRIEQRFKR